jgi:hypothetical protein
MDNRLDAFGEEIFVVLVESHSLLGRSAAEVVTSPD